jgi:hypothetical protein
MSMGGKWPSLAKGQVVGLMFDNVLVVLEV